MQKTLIWLRRITAAAMLGLLVLLSAQCIGLYLAGSSPDNLSEDRLPVAPVFTAEEVRSRLGACSPLFAACALLTVASLAIETAAAPPGRPLPLPPENRLRLMKARISHLPEAALAEERRRRVIRLYTALALLICILFSLAYLGRRENFASWELEPVVGRMLAHIGPWIALGLAALIASAIACRRSVQKEAALLAPLPKEAPAQSVLPRRLPANALRIALFAAAAALIAHGMVNGGLTDVLVKAINICTECIGLG